MRESAAGVAARVERLGRALQQASREQVGAFDTHALREIAQQFFPLERPLARDTARVQKRFIFFDVVARFFACHLQVAARRKGPEAEAAGARGKEAADRLMRVVQVLCSMCLRVCWGGL